MHRLASRLRTHLKDRSRGQSLVEFGLVLPIILLLTLAALDFGRIYLGYINIQNMARIAANFAADNPDAWDATADSTDAENLASYQNQILGDASATNCDLPLVSGTKTAPPPTFTDANADGTSEIGDTAKVSLTCTFHVITPVISNIVGGSIQVSASSVFPVKTAMTSSGGGFGGPIPPPVAAFTGNTVEAPSSLSGVAPFTVVFRDTSGGSPTGWNWAFPDDGTSSPLQDVTHIFQDAGTFIVTMTASNSAGSSFETQSITVTDPEDVDFTANPDPPSILIGDTVTFTDTSSAGGTNPTWTFGAGEGGGTGTTVTHTYNTIGSFEVTLTVTYASGDKVLSRVGYVNVGAGTCTVPKFDGVRRYVAQDLWNASLFTGLVLDGPSAPSGNYLINAQSLVYNSPQPCNSDIIVNRVNP
jgi:PKD repeat protein